MGLLGSNKPRVLLSSVVTFPRTEPAFRMAKELGFDGLELFPYRWTTTREIKRLSEAYAIRISGIHLPFWWHTKPLWKVWLSEYQLREWAFATLWFITFGSGKKNCPAIRLKADFPEAYVLIHPDTYHQALRAEQDINAWLLDREIFFENERPKKDEQQSTYDLISLKGLIETFPDQRGRLMFDPGHFMLAQTLGKVPKQLHIPTLYTLSIPEGLHLSFSDEGRLHDLPTPEEWKELADKINQDPPQYLVVETKPGLGSRKRVDIARKMILRDLGV